MGQTRFLRSAPSCRPAPAESDDVSPGNPWGSGTQNQAQILIDQKKADGLGVRGTQLQLVTGQPYSSLWSGMWVILRYLMIFLHAQVAVDPHNSALSDMKEGENQEHAGIHLEIGGFELLEMATWFVCQILSTSSAPKAIALRPAAQGREAMAMDSTRNEVRNTWRFPEIGVPLVIIHFTGIFHEKTSLLGTPISGTPHQKLWCCLGLVSCRRQLFFSRATKHRWNQEHLRARGKTKNGADSNHWHLVNYACWIFHDFPSRVDSQKRPVQSTSTFLQGSLAKNQVRQLTVHWLHSLEPFFKFHNCHPGTSTSPDHQTKPRMNTNTSAICHPLPTSCASRIKTAWDLQSSVILSSSH